MNHKSVSKVLIIGPVDLTTGGIASSIHSLSEMFSLQGYKVEIINTYTNGNITRRVTVFLSALVKYLRNILNSDIVSIHFSWKWSLLRKLTFILLAYLIGKKTVLHYHADSKYIDQNWTVLYKLVFCLCHSFVITKQDTMNPVFNNASYFPNVLDRPALRQADKKNYMVYVGRNDPKKGIQSLVKAWQQFIDVNQEWELHTFSDKPLKAEREHWHGWTNKETLYAVLNESKIILLPSYSEGLPMSLIEAISFGVVPIASDVGGIKDIVNKKTGYLLASQNVDELLAAMHLSVSNEKLLKVKSINCLEHFKQEFSMMAGQKRLLNALKKI